MTVATENPTQDQAKSLHNVDNYTWEQVVNQFGVSAYVFQRFGVTPQMMTEEGEKKYYKDIKQEIEGNIVFDKDFVIFKLVRMFMAMELYDEDGINNLMEDVKSEIKEEHEKEQNQKLNEIREKAKELGLSPDQLMDLLSS